MSWSAAIGQVAFYTVHLYQDGQLETSHENLDNRTLETVFTNRTRGVYYCVVVVTKSRTSETNSLEVCGATGELEQSIMVENLPSFLMGPHNFKLYYLLLLTYIVDVSSTVL